MKNKNIMIFLCLIMVILSFIHIYSLYFNQYDYKNIYTKYLPDYKEKYNEVLNNYDLISEKYTFIPAQIIGTIDNNISKIFYVNRGKKDSVVENSYVVDESGLVGIVKKVFDNYSIIELISSGNINIAVEINDCYGTLKNNTVGDLINCDYIKVGDAVFTSKYSMSSSNILIGHIKEIKDNKIKIEYSFNPYKLKYLGIIYDKY